MKSRNLNFLESSGPLQACNGTDLYFTPKSRTYTTVVVLVILYGCETWCVIVSEEHRLMVSEKRVLRGVFGLKREEAWKLWDNMEMGLRWNGVARTGCV